MTSLDLTDSVWSHIKVTCYVCAPGCEIFSRHGFENDELMRKDPYPLDGGGRGVYVQYILASKVPENMYGTFVQAILEKMYRTYFEVFMVHLKSFCHLLPQTALTCTNHQICYICSNNLHFFISWLLLLSPIVTKFHNCTSYKFCYWRGPPPPPLPRLSQTSPLPPHPMLQ